VLHKKRRNRTRLLSETESQETRQLPLTSKSNSPKTFRGSWSLANGDFTHDELDMKSRRRQD